MGEQGQRRAPVGANDLPKKKSPSTTGPSSSPETRGHHAIINEKRRKTLPIPNLLSGPPSEGGRSLTLECGLGSATAFLNGLIPIFFFFLTKNPQLSNHPHQNQPVILSYSGKGLGEATSTSTLRPPPPPSFNRTHHSPQATRALLLAQPFWLCSLGFSLLSLRSSRREKARVGAART